MHYGHKNICRGVTCWTEIDEKTGLEIPAIKSTRDFPTLESMNEALVENINKYVKPHDILWHLGDWSFGEDNVELFRKSLNVKTIHLILGNHDATIAKSQKLQSLFNSVELGYGWPKGKKIGGRQYVFSHFPFLVWDNHMYGAIHLHGHSHGSNKDPNYYSRKVMDVGVDCHPEFRPFHLDEIIKIMDGRETSKVDHHGNREL
jgi:calcineurin-like phosphoesterase family protein